MFDTFTDEIELLIKEGITHIFWYKSDLKKAWLNSGVNHQLCESLFSQKNEYGQPLTKRQLNDLLYDNLRNEDYNRRLEISRNFVRILVEWTNFRSQDEKHKIEKAENCALKLKEILNQQKLETNKNNQRSTDPYKEQEQEKSSQTIYFENLTNLREKFNEVIKLSPQKRGYELEKIFSQLMRISNVPVEKSFKIIGEQIDGAIKYDGHYYLVELKWMGDKANQKDISSLYLKVEGKMDVRGLFIAMNGYSSELLESLPKGKEIKVLLLDGCHLTKVISSIYTFQELMDYAIKRASLKAEIYCDHRLE